MDVIQKIQRLFERAAKNPKFHSIVVRLEAPGIEFQAAEGHADGIKRTPMTESTPYFLASITKLFTSVTTMTLARAGELDLDTPLTAYLDPALLAGIHVIDGVDHTPSLTCRHLLSQTSGLADYFAGPSPDGHSLEDDLLAGNDRHLTLDEVLDIVRRAEPEFPPGFDRAFYSDTNFQLLGAVIESIKSVPLAATFAELIFDPLGLQNSFLFDHTAQQPPPAVLWNGRYSIQIPMALSSFGPDGGGVTTASDAMRFLRAFFDGELLTPEEVTTMTDRWNRIYFPFEYGLGVQRFKLPRIMSPWPPPPVLLGHAGSTGSFSFYEPSKQAYIVGTVNQTDNPSRPYRMIVQMMNAL